MGQVVDRGTTRALSLVVVIFHILRHVARSRAEPQTTSNERDKTGLGDMKRYLCVICGLIYDEEAGWPEDGIAPGTRWDDVPDTWKCPECGAGKEDFEMVEV